MAAGFLGGVGHIPHVCMVACLRSGGALAKGRKAFESCRRPRQGFGWWPYIFGLLAVILGCQVGGHFVLIGLFLEEEDVAAGGDGAGCSCATTTSSPGSSDSTGEPGASGELTTFEAQQQVGGSPTAGGALPVHEVLQALQQLPDALAKMGKPKGLIDPRGLGKPQVLGDDSDTRFRL